MGSEVSDLLSAAERGTGPELYMRRVDTVEWRITQHFKRTLLIQLEEIENSPDKEEPELTFHQVPTFRMLVHGRDELEMCHCQTV